MAATNKITVRIYGQDYTITGEKSPDEIQRVARHVDETMNAISEAVGGGSVSSLAVLTAINIADELYDNKARLGGFDDEKERLKVDVDHYMQLLEKTKNEFQQYKRDARESLERKTLIEETLNSKQRENEDLAKRVAELEQHIEKLKAQAQGEQPVSSERVRELEDRCREVEGNYFELQMENIRLKGDLERYQREDD
ncbi:MAG: cell division protein ZapA [Clostridiales Family XIII bacterium]|jgi:cell division protein ZapA (FtsZ GTPase activity inhibitor)|nr:cell division protein ZapA [Clostridiales Family XIII bacterium]